MWTEFREIDAEMIVELFEAVTALELLTKNYMEGLKDDEDEDGEGDKEDIVVPLEPEADWVDHLKVIKDNVHHYINVPGAVPSGFRGRSHKASTKAFGLSLILGATRDGTNEHSQTYAGSTFDFGAESQLPVWAVEGGAASLLPPWLGTEPIEPEDFGSDVDIMPCHSADDPAEKCSACTRS